MSNLAAANEPLPTYRASCGRCGGRGGQEIHGDREWVDCDCLGFTDCPLCGVEVDVRSEVFLIVLDGREQAVCPHCFLQEPDDDD